ncbi:hypothetical protein RDWZM_010117 [Blomia tropicalis]|uniref:Uncharacterized protein n=1 Tax=Blomia tropicalis TaxID=40697 RepID=A0A9Q0LYK0_BLOTA|nr:Protein fam76b [Blomia tropicalis]KAJ6215617.1 hypothetical protein RDWZM_010117 [Blomia tropicalis]
MANNSAPFPPLAPLPSSSATMDYSNNENGETTMKSDSLHPCSRCRLQFGTADLRLMDEQLLCKECRRSFMKIKCEYCRTEFRHNAKLYGFTSQCTTCSNNLVNYGKPRYCVYCRILAAWNGNKCQRCNNFEVLYGAPVKCDQCNMNSAFDESQTGHDTINYHRMKRNEDQIIRKKLLCWLCTQSYQRALAKANEKSDSFKERILMKSRSSSSDKKRDYPFHSRSDKDHRKDDKESKKTRSDMVTNTENGNSSSNINGGNNNGNINGSNGDSLKMQSTSSSSISSNSNSNENSSSPADSRPSLQLLPLPGILMESMPNFNGREKEEVVTGLQEKLASLERQIKQKAQEMMKKDIKITELRSELSKEQRDNRERITSLQKSQRDRLYDFQQKVTTLSKSITSIQKRSKKSHAEKLVKDDLLMPMII